MKICRLCWDIVPEDYEWCEGSKVERHEKCTMFFKDTSEMINHFAGIYKISSNNWNRLDKSIRDCGPEEINKIFWEFTNECDGGAMLQMKIDEFNLIFEQIRSVYNKVRMTGIPSCMDEYTAKMHVQLDAKMEVVKEIEKLLPSVYQRATGKSAELIMLDEAKYINLKQTLPEDTELGEDEKI